MFISIPVNQMLARIIQRVQERDAILRLVTCNMLCVVLLTLSSGSGTLDIALYSVGSLGIVSCLQATAPLAKALGTIMLHESIRQRGIGLIAISSALGRSIGPIVGSSLDTNSAYGVVLLVVTFALLVSTLYLYPRLEAVSNEAERVPPTEQPQLLGQLLNKLGATKVWFAIFDSPLMDFLQSQLLIMASKLQDHAHDSASASQVGASSTAAGEGPLHIGKSASQV
jgi:hypothetical protein